MLYSPAFMHIFKIPDRLSRGWVCIGKGTPGDSDTGYKKGWKIRPQSQESWGLTREQLDSEPELHDAVPCGMTEVCREISGKSREGMIHPT